VSPGRCRSALAATVSPMATRGASRTPSDSAARTARSTAVQTVRASANFTSVLAGCTFTSTMCGGTSMNRKASKPRSPPPAER
jgi:hypothetical protein